MRDYTNNKFDFRTPECVAHTDLIQCTDFSGVCAFFASAAEYPASVHALLKPEHAVRELLVHLLRSLRIVGIGVVAVEELYNVEAASVDVEVDVALLKIRCDRLPNPYLRVQLLHSHQAA